MRKADDPKSAHSIIVSDNFNTHAAAGKIIYSDNPKAVGK